MSTGLVSTPSVHPSRVENGYFKLSKRHFAAKMRTPGNQNIEDSSYMEWVGRERASFWGVFWIDASSIESIRRGFIDIVKEAAAMPDITFENAKAWIENRAEKWLLIFDNADDPKIDYFKYLPSGEGSCILMTTRNDGCKIYGSESTGYEKFEKLEFPDAVELLLKTAEAKQNPHNSEAAERLVGDEVLAQHTLSIVHAGAFIRQGLCRLDEYATMFESQQARLLSQHPDQANSVYGDVYATFEVSAKAIMSESKQEYKDALELLKVLAHLHREGVSEDMFTRACNEAQDPKQGWQREPENSIRIVSSWHTDRLWRFLHPLPATKELDVFSMRKAKNVLLSFSLINVHPDTYEISMHPLVHTWARDRLEVEMQDDAWCTAAATLALSKAHLGYQEYFNNIQPHVEFNISLRPKDYFLAQKWNTLEICRVFYRFAWMLCRQRNDTGALSLLDLISSLQCPAIPPNSLNWRHILFIYACCHEHLGNSNEQLRLIKEVVSFDCNAWKPDNPSRLTAQEALGAAQIKQGNYQEAIEILEGVVKIRQDIIYPESQGLLRSKHKLAMVYTYNKQPEKAIWLLKEVVQIQERILAPTHPYRLASQHELAFAYIENEQLEQAIQLLKEVVQIKERILAPTHPERLGSQHELARAYYYSGQYQQALPIIQEVVRIQEETLKADHPYRMMAEEALDAMSQQSRDQRRQTRR
ncbi:Nephrocystin-3 [Lachnellula arida]|uniref:Nephrocystin-3 n=1 Tax=Lachnellula arida TaxID=1316785 RepID=A0A8T9BF56_9HELO|nr:Nephrocystin-3 [Lachnellula arida]